MIEWRIRKGRMYYSARECWQLLKRDNWKMKHQGIKYLFCDFYWVIILSFFVNYQLTILHTHKYQQSPYLISIQQNPPQIVKKKHKKKIKYCLQKSTQTPTISPPTDKTHEPNLNPNSTASKHNLNFAIINNNITITINIPYLLLF